MRPVLPLVVLCAWCGLWTAAQSVTLPVLTFDAVPAAVRDLITAAYEEARTRPRDEQAVERLAMLLHAYEQYESADACYAAARQLAPDALTPTYLSAVVQSQRGDLSLAIASLRRAVAIDSEYLPARVRLADLLLKTGDVAGSAAAYAALIEEYPELALGHYGLGQVADAMRNPAAAARHYERAVAAAPEFGAAHYALALAYRDAGRVDEARPQLEAWSRLGSRRPALRDRWLERVRALRSTARDRIAEAGRLERDGEMDRAIAVLLEAIDADPAAAQAHVNLIALYGRTGKAAEAEAHYRAALALESSLAEAHYNYGVLLAQTDRAAEAADAFSKALAIDPFHAAAHNNLAALLARAGRLDEAAAHYRAALANDPQHRTARFNLGRVLVALGRPREAIEQLQRALAPEDAATPPAMYALARAYLAAGDGASARRYARRALGLARQFGQSALAAQIEAALPAMREAPR